MVKNKQINVRAACKIIAEKYDLNMETVRARYFEMKRKKTQEVVNESRNRKTS